ncbi:hypothetical protein K432DRAFT_270950, partial [Lepidopterella palustris CBS 459.81]
YAEIIRLLTSKGLDINARDKYVSAPVHDICRVGRQEIARLVVELGADLSRIDKFGRTPFTVACQYGQPNYIEYL